MRLNHAMMERLREEYSTAVVESLSAKDKDAYIFHLHYVDTALLSEEELRVTVTNKFGRDFWDELRESIIAEEMI